MTVQVRWVRHLFLRVLIKQTAVERQVRRLAANPWLGTRGRLVLAWLRLVRFGQTADPHLKTTVSGAWMHDSSALQLLSGAT